MDGQACSSRAQLARLQPRRQLPSVSTAQKRREDGFGCFTAAGRSEDRWRTALPSRNLKPPIEKRPAHQKAHTHARVPPVRINTTAGDDGRHGTCSGSERQNRRDSAGQSGMYSVHSAFIVSLVVKRDNFEELGLTAAWHLSFGRLRTYLSTLLVLCLVLCPL